MAEMQNKLQIMSLAGVARFPIFLDFSKFSSPLIFFNEFLTHNLLRPTFNLIMYGFNVLNPSTYSTKVAMFEGQPIPVE